MFHGLKIPLRDLVAQVAATDGAGDGCQGLAVTAADLTSYQASDDRANAHADRAVSGARTRLLVDRCRRMTWRGIVLCVLRPVLVLPGSSALYISVVNNGLVLDNFSDDHGGGLLLWGLDRNQRVLLCRGRGRYGLLNWRH